MNTSIENLEPKLVWGFFSQICSIPRPSKKEEKIRQYLIDTAKTLGLSCKVTQIGNVIISKPATKGMENRKKVTLQAHMDMVPAKLQSVAHNFETDPIKAYIDNEWVRADGTTLGADNGIGIAYGLAILASKELAHGNLELLVTTDEEAGMTGAFGLNYGDISGDILLNLDSEEDHEVCIGCAGGINTNIRLPITWVSYDTSNKCALKIVLDGLYSGHSGVDIHLGRANAIKEIANLLVCLAKDFKFELVHISGGKLRNVIAGYCEVIIVINEADKAKISKFIESFEEKLKNAFKLQESKLQLKAHLNELPKNIIEPSIANKFILALNSCFNGLYKMNWDINIPQVSSNLGKISILKNNNPSGETSYIEIITLQRSPDDFSKKSLASSIASNFELIGANIEHNGDYPGWLPNISSEILRVVRDSYQELFDSEMKISATHGGLECGLILGKFPNIDAVSIGATIRDPHSANERVNIQSVGKVWELITKILHNIPVTHCL